MSQHFTVHIRETWKGPGAQRPSFIAKPHHNLKRLFEVYMLKKNGPPLEMLICVYKEKIIEPAVYEKPLLELGFVDGDEITVYKIHFSPPEKDNDVTESPGASENNDIAELPSTFEGDFKHLYANKMFSDIMFIVEGEKMPAHKCILAARCAKFRAMFQDCFKEGQQSEITLDCKLVPFQVMLEYLYTNNIPDNCDVLFDVLALAEEYLLLHLKSICENKMLQNLDLYNAASMLAHADLYRCETLKKYCLQFILTSHELLIMLVPQFESDLKKAPHLMMEIMRAITRGNQDYKRQKYAKAE